MGQNCCVEKPAYQQDDKGDGFPMYTEEPTAMLPAAPEVALHKRTMTLQSKHRDSHFMDKKLGSNL